MAKGIEILYNRYTKEIKLYYTHFSGLPDKTYKRIEDLIQDIKNGLIDKKRKKRLIIFKIDEDFPLEKRLPLEETIRNFFKKPKIKYFSFY